MLLKTSKRSNNRKFVNPMSPAHQRAMSVRAQQICNVYEPKEKRLAKKIDA